jgi:hypothetical protein
MASAPSFAQLGAPAGLCARCVHARLLASSRSVFVRCARADIDPRYPRYPPLPVLRCGGFDLTPLPPSPVRERGAGG